MSLCCISRQIAIQEADGDLKLLHPVASEQQLRTRRYKERIDRLNTQSGARCASGGACVRWIADGAIVARTNLVHVLQRLVPIFGRHVPLLHGVEERMAGHVPLDGEQRPQSPLVLAASVRRSNLPFSLLRKLFFAVKLKFILIRDHCRRRWCGRMKRERAG